jgi:hypothetical protein
MNLSGWIDPRVEKVRVADMESYLLSHGYKRMSYPRPEMLVFGGVLDDNGEEIIQVLPSSERMRDYRLRVVELISSLSVFEDRPAIAILNDILAQSGTRPPTNGQNGVGTPVRST